MLRKGGFFLAAVMAVGCTDRFGNEEPFNPLRDSFDIDVRGVNVTGAEGDRVVVAIYNRTQDNLEARADSAIGFISEKPVTGERFRFFWDNELERGMDYAIYWWVDTGVIDDCHDDTVYRVLIDDVQGDYIGDNYVRLDPEVDEITGCDNVDGNYPLTD